MTRSLRSLLLVLPLLLLTGCFTMALWGGDLEEDEEYDHATGRYESTLEPDLDFSNVRSWSDFFRCLALTPFALALDCLTFPVQAALFGWDDGED